MNTSNPVYSTLSELVLSDQIYKDKAEMLFKFISFMEDYNSLGSPGIFVMTRPRGFGLSLITQAITNLIKENVESNSAINIKSTNHVLYKLGSKSKFLNKDHEQTTEKIASELLEDENKNVTIEKLESIASKSIFEPSIEDAFDNFNVSKDNIKEKANKSKIESLSINEEIEAIKSFYNICAHPIINIDFKRLNAKNAKEFSNSLIDIIQELFWLNHIESHVDLYQTPKVFFKKLISEFSKKYSNKQIVILIDNYDVPFLTAANFDDDQAQEAICDYLDMLNVLKYSNHTVKWCLLSGHIKFKLASEISEGLPLVNDLSCHSLFSNLFGLTRDDVADIYHNEIDKYSFNFHMTPSQYLDALEDCYGGFVFGENDPLKDENPEKMICPACIAHCMTNNGQLLPYSASGRYVFLKDVLNSRQADLDWLYGKDGQDPLFADSIDISVIGKQLGTLLIHLGFASIAKVNINKTDFYTTWRYRFEFPNLDMKKTFEYLTNNASIDDLTKTLITINNPDNNNPQENS